MRGWLPLTGLLMLSAAACSSSAAVPADPAHTSRPATQVEWLDVPGDDILTGCDGPTRFYRISGKGLTVIPNDPRCMG